MSTAVDVAWVGIDVGKQAHHAALIDAEGKELWSLRVRNDQAEIEALVTRASDTAIDVRWAVDLTSAHAALLLAVLVASAAHVLYVPGRIVNRMADAFAGEAKTDAKDARTIAETARLRRDLTTLTTPDELVVELARLVGHREDLMTDWVRGINRLRDLLTSVFPGLEQAFDYSNRAPLVLVANYCTPDAIRQAGVDGLIESMAGEGVRHGIASRIAGPAVDAAAAQTLQLPGEAITADLVHRQARALLGIDREIKDLGKTITSRFRDHPQAKIIESLPGMGPILGAEFLAATGGADLAAFGSPAKLATYAGLAPVPHDSGRRAGVLHRPRRYHRRLRHVFYMAAFSSLKRPGPSRTFYDRKRSERQRHVRAVIALARRLIDVLWAMLRDNREWSAAGPEPALAA